MRAALLSTIFIASVVVGATPPPATPTQTIPLQHDPLLAVTNATAVQVGEQVFLFGGTLEDGEPTAAIQVRNSNGTWRPVGSQMIIPRVRADVIALADGRVVVSGTGQDFGELLQPLVAGSSRIIAKPTNCADQTPCAPVALANGDFATIYGESLYRFDATAHAWQAAIPLLDGAQTATLGVTGDQDLLIAMGNGTIHLCHHESHSTAVWSARVQADFKLAQLHPLRDGTWLLAMINDEQQLQLARLNPRNETIHDGPTTTIDWAEVDGIALASTSDGAALFVSGKDDTTGRAELFHVQTLGSTNLRLWTMKTPLLLPEHALVRHSSVGVELIAGPAIPARQRRNVLKDRAAMVQEVRSILVQLTTPPIGD